MGSTLRVGSGILVRCAGRSCDWDRGTVLQQDLRDHRELVAKHRGHADSHEQISEYWTWSVNDLALEAARLGFDPTVLKVASIRNIVNHIVAEGSDSVRRTRKPLGKANK